MGTTFSVYLPSIDAPPTASRELKSEALSFGTEKIMIVDDEHSIIALVQELLKGLGYQTSGFMNSSDALNAFQANPKNYDLVITDQTMPELTGSELAECLLNIRRDIPIILITGHSELVTARQAMEKGIRKFMLKPVDITELASAIRETLDNPV
jgi:two-component system cell cycle sensor histidine kinase/response regulator CckA